MSLQAPERDETTPIEVLPPGAPGTPVVTDASSETEVLANPTLTAVAIFLSVAAAGWMSAGIFRGGFARAVGLGGAALGVGMIALSYRMRRPSVVQYLALPIAIVAGALLVLPDTKGGTANLPGLVSEAIRSGGVAQPPIAFDPGWRFILLLLTSVVGSAAASLATAMNRPKLGIFMPVPLLFGAALIQPKNATALSTIVALVLLIAALGVSYGVELQREGATSGQFELRRLARGAGVVAALIGVLAVLLQAGFLFPEPNRKQVIPPKRPEVQPPQADRSLFTARADKLVPWRLGVLDVYDGRAWLTPPFDTDRLKTVPVRSGRVPGATPPPPAATPAPATLSVRTVAPVATPPPPITVTFTIHDIAGHVVPTVAGPRTISRKGFALQFDPRTQELRLPEKRATKGMTYTIEANPPPSGHDLSLAPAPPPSMKAFLFVPPPPTDVAALLAAAPTGNLWDRLSFVRNAFYQKVVASGAGNPVDVPPFRVSDMLNGKEATPYEITAAEVLLARWAGIPARIGYGFYGGDKKDPNGNEYDVHPKHGSTWLEAWFAGYGWIPIVGIPPKAKASLSQSQKQNNPAVRPSEELALVVYVPLQLQTVRLVFVVVRYWVVRALPVAAGLLLVGAFYPGFLKLARRRRRRRWAHAGDTADRIRVAYAEFRDLANDFNAGEPAATPIEFLDWVDPDAEHAELAWLVTRALWGDLVRDLRPQDAEFAEDMAASVTRRLRRAQPAITRILGFASRASLRDPYAVEIPNLWRTRRRGAVRRRLRRIRRLIPIIGLIAMTGCGTPIDLATTGKIALPTRIAPDTIDAYRFQREQKVEAAFTKPGKVALVNGGRIFTVRQGGDVQGYLEVASFKPGLVSRQSDVRDGVLKHIGTGRFEPSRIGTDRVFVQKASEQTLYLWFPPNGRYFELLVARKGFDTADRLFAALLGYQRGEEASAAFGSQRVGVFDPRRGGDE